MKPLKFPSDDKDFNFLAKRLAEAERKFLTDDEEENEEQEEETPSEKERRCAELRHERVMKLAEVMGYEEALSHWRYNISDYELRWEFLQALRVPSERRYQSLKKRWLWHESSWWMRRFTTLPPLTEYDGYGCNENVCIPGCRFYEPIGTIENEELQKLEAEEHRKEQEMIRAQFRFFGINEDEDDDETKKRKWEEIRQLKNQISKKKGEYLQRRQHTFQSVDDLKAIETDMFNEYYNEKVKNKRIKETIRWRLCVSLPHLPLRRDLIAMSSEQL